VRIGLLAAAAGALVLWAAPAAVANGRFPASNQLVLSPSDPNFVVLRTTFGILLSHDGGVTWHWLCEDVLGISSSSSQDPLMGVTATERIVAGPGLSNGLVLSQDSGCSWSAAGGPLAGQLVIDLVVRPDAPDVVLVLTSTYGPEAGVDGSPGYTQQIYRSTDDAANWSALGTPIDPSALATTIDVAAADPHRIYVSAIRSANTARSASLLVSADDGASWTERPVQLDPNLESAIYIAGVDPASPDRVYIRTAGATSRLLVTSDAGQTFQSPLSLSGSMLGFALSPDGSKVYAGNVKQGLFVAARESLSFQNVSPIRVQCLATQGSDLWACSDEPSGFIAGVSRDDGATFAAKLHLSAPPTIECAAQAGAAAQCSGAPRQALCRVLVCDTDSGSGPPPTPISAKACGCSAIGPRRDATALMVAGALCVVARWRGRRGRRARSVPR
jgi:hypothetical protein